MNKCTLAFASAAAMLSLFAEDPVLDGDLRSGLVLWMDANTNVALDFDGVKTVRGLRVDGTPVFGTVSAGTCPSITGRGSLTVCPVGMTIIFR